MSSPFKVLKLNDQMMIWLQINTHHRLTDVANNNFPISMRCISLNLFAFALASATFVYQNTANVMLALRTGTVTLGTSQALGMFLSIGCNFDNVKLLHRKLQAIVDQTARGKISQDQE